MHPKLSEALDHDQLTAMAAPDHLVDWRLLLSLEAVHGAGVLERIPGDVDEVAADLGLDADAVAACLQVLVAWGVLRRDGRRFTWDEPRLTEDEVTVLAQHGVWIRRWAANLGPRLRDRHATSPIAPQGLPAPVGLRLLQLATRAAVAPVATLCWEALGTRATAERPRVLDLGGGHGAYSLALAQRGAAVTLQDLPPVIEHLRTRPEFEPVTLVAADMHRELAGDHVDLVLLSTVTNMFDPPRVATLLQRVAEVVTPGGAVVIVSHLRERGPVGAAFGVQMLVATMGGDAHGEQDYRGWLEDAGLVVESVDQLTDSPLCVLVARKS
ncbi:MAG: class I SAM-dependent methyltransferase [Arachnia propionica]|uniref:class I SAM-dependent methyltransferase n=1 Tax=Arachnia propionica TaxID=1750 RepID=UPI0026FF63C3|nr:class I SAM-dependent methyltransferase [Arachnia propionica]